jgi:hypothetical protein
MDPQHVDSVARSLARNSRRGVLAGLAVTALTALTPGGRGLHPREL